MSVRMSLHLKLMTEVWDILAVTITAHIENKFNNKVAFVVAQLLFNLDMSVRMSLRLKLMTEVWNILAVKIAAHIENKFKNKVAMVGD